MGRIRAPQESRKPSTNIALTTASKSTMTRVIQTQQDCPIEPRLNANVRGLTPSATVAINDRSNELRRRGRAIIPGGDWANRRNSCIEQDSARRSHVGPLRHSRRAGSVRERDMQTCSCVVLIVQRTQPYSGSVIKPPR